MSAPIRIVIVTGVAGSGKTTVGRALAGRLGWTFHDADDLHTPENIERMRNNIPLDDQQRQPWLLRVRAVVERAGAHDDGAVMACSALKERYRQTIAGGLPGVRFVFLSGDPALLRKRLEDRGGHFAGAALLGSQLDTLEPPSDALQLDVALTVDALIEAIVRDISDSRA